ncbi:MAG: tetratricopeptide repeat protein, partial [Abditibacteriota bacterium]|nr:tetratricopeptide repeat protein [Abditibacteriota bacterium]
HAYNNRGLTYFKGEVYDSAILDYSTAIDLNKAFADAYYNRAVAKNKIGDTEGAKEDMKRAGELNPKYAVNSYVKRAGLSVYSKQVTDYSKAISENPNNQSPYLARAIAYRKLGNIAGALQDCNTALKLNDRDSECYLVRGEVQFYARNYDEAINDFSKSLSLRHDAITLYFRSIAKRRKGDYAGAIQDQAKALDMRPRLADDYVNRGYAKSNTGDFLGAVEDFEMARDIFKEKHDEKREKDMDELIKKTGRRK